MGIFNMNLWPLWLWALGMSALILYVVNKGRQRKSLQGNPKQPIVGQLRLDRLVMQWAGRGNSVQICNVLLEYDKDFQMIQGTVFYARWNGHRLRLSNHDLTKKPLSSEVPEFVAKIRVDPTIRLVESLVVLKADRLAGIHFDWVISRS